MFRTLIHRTTQATQKDLEGSVFNLVRSATTEVASAGVPADLESLVRSASAIASFNYPAFSPAMLELGAKYNDPVWIEHISRDAERCPQKHALRYMKALVPLNLPEQVMASLLKRVHITSKNDVAEFVDFVRMVDPNSMSRELRTATQYVLKSAISNNCHLSTYNSIFELIDEYWRVAKNHLVPVSMRSSLIAAAWASLLRLDIQRDQNFREAVRWLTLNHPLVGNKESMDECLSKLEVRAKGYIAHEELTAMLSSVFRVRKPVLAEPLDTISQLLVRKLNVSRLSVSELTELAEAVRSYRLLGKKSTQIEALVHMVLPELLRCLSVNLSSVPSKSLPSALHLLLEESPSEATLELVQAQLIERGRELDAVALVRLVNACHLDHESLVGLFATDLSGAEYVNQLVSKLSFADKLELVSTLSLASDPRVSVFTNAVQTSLISDMSENPRLASELEVSTLIKLVSVGDEALACVGISPSIVLVDFLRSDRGSKLSVNQALQLLQAPDVPEAAGRALFAHIVAHSPDLSAMDTMQLLHASLVSIGDAAYVTTAVKLLIPLITKLDEIDVLLQLVPDMFSQLSATKYAPSTQLREAVLDRVAVVAPRLGLERSVESLIQLARLNYYSADAVDALTNSACMTDSAAALPMNTLTEAVVACKHLRAYNGVFLDMLTRHFLRRQAGDSVTAGEVAQFAAGLVALGNKHESVLRACEHALRQVPEIGVRISLLNSLAKSQCFSPVFQDQLRLVLEFAAGNVSALSDEDWVGLFEINLAVVLESPPRVRSKYVNDLNFKQFFEDNCGFSWYAQQDRARNAFIYSTTREEMAEAIESLGWTGMRTPGLGDFVYHIDFVSTTESTNSDSNKFAVVSIPESDELRKCSDSPQSVRVIVGDSMTRIKQLQLLGFKVVPVWMSEWSRLSSVEQRKECLLRNSTQVVFALGPKLF